MDAGALQRLVDEADCRALLMRYGPAVDWRDRAALETLFWPDATIDLGVFKGSGAEAPDFLITGASLRRLHITTSVSLRLDGDGGEAESCAITHAITGGPEVGMASHLYLGRYLDLLERRAGEWRIASRLYVLHGQVSDAYLESPALAAMTKADSLSSGRPLPSPTRREGMLSPEPSPTPIQEAR